MFDRPLPEWAEMALLNLAKQFPGWDFGLTYHQEDQAQGRCPLTCRGGNDRFVVFENGNCWCRQCHGKATWRQEDKEERAERQEKAKQTRLALQAQMAACLDWQVYNAQVCQAYDLWSAQGIDQSDIERWGLGYCSRVPHCAYESPSLTIPVFHKRKLVDIRHRLLQPQGADKYRSHLPSLPPSYFNLDGLLEQPDCFIVEGEKKAVVLNHHGLPTASFPGLGSANYLADMITQELRPSQVLHFIPDPGTKSALDPTILVLRNAGFKVKVLDLMLKPDDLVRKYGIQPILKAIPYARWY